MEDIDKSAMELLDFRTISNRDMADCRFFPAVTAVPAKSNKVLA